MRTERTNLNAHGSVSYGRAILWLEKSERQKMRGLAKCTLEDAQAIREAITKQKLYEQPKHVIAARILPERPARALRLLQWVYQFPPRQSYFMFPAGLNRDIALRRINGEEVV